MLKIKHTALHGVWQENRGTTSYIKEIEKHFGTVVRHGQVIEASDPIKQKGDSWENADGSIRFSRGSDQTETPQFKKWFGDWELAAKANVLQGIPVLVLNGHDAPHGYPLLRKWATGLFDKWGNKAISPTLGEVTLDANSVDDSMGHRMNPFKAEAFAAVKDVIESGILVLSGREKGVISHYVSAPVRIRGVDDIVTVLVHQDANTNRMYLHSVTTKENLLKFRDSGADTVKASKELPGKVTSGDVATVLHNLLNFNPSTVSKVVDADGKPLVVYHGTDADITEFRSRSRHRVLRQDGKELKRADPQDLGPDGLGNPDSYHYIALSDAEFHLPKDALSARLRELEGLEQRNPGKSFPDSERIVRDLERLSAGGPINKSTESRPSGVRPYFTPDKDYSFISKSGGWDGEIREGGNVLPVYLSIKNPIYLDASAIESAGWNWEQYARQGYDGAIFAGNKNNLEQRDMMGGSTQIVAFDPTQVKSAIGNNGNFDGTNPDIRFSRGPVAAARDTLAAARELNLAAGYKLGDFRCHHPVLKLKVRYGEN